MIHENADGQEHTVEISGWDTEENFFVESASMGWEEGEENTVRLRTRVRPGSMIFLRLMEASVQPRTFPVAFRVMNVSAKMDRYAYEALLRRLWPRPNDRRALPGQPAGAAPPR
jgi:hypothetical protein